MGGMISKEVRQIGEQRSAVITCGPPAMETCASLVIGRKGFKGLEYAEDVILVG